jgi:hypothetical protein
MAGKFMGANSWPMEHRWGNRVTLDAPVQIRTTTGVSAAARVRNASISGAFVDTSVNLPLLGRVLLRPLSDSGEWLDACVVRVEPCGVAVEWLDPALHAVSALLALRREPDSSASSRAANDGHIPAPPFLRGLTP